jgi:hypothetical protein
MSAHQYLDHDALCPWEKQAFGTTVKLSLPVSATQILGLDAACPGERRARSSVGLGCPSAGGQRTAGARFSIPLAKLVRKSRPFRFASVLQCLRSPPQHVMGTSPGLGLPLWLACLTETASTPVRRSRAPVTHSAASGLSRPSAWGWRATVGASPAPNHSVKGTSCACAQAAPYLER